jgi:glycerol uptake facilitator-like aquaporin
MLLRRHLGEFLGTALLVMAVVGSGIMATGLTDDVGLQLLANAVATGGALFALITVFGPVSGASFNPVVSVIGRILDGGPGLRVVAADIVAQFAGAVVGCWAANAMFSRPWLETSSKVRDGGPQWFAEAVAVIGLVLVIRGGIRAKANVAAMVAGWITGAYWFTSSTSIANPAVAFGRMFSDSFAGISPGSTPMFVVMQVAGGAVALGLVLVLFGRGD